MANKNLFSSALARFLPQTDAAQGERVAERLRAAVAASPLPAGSEEPLPLTVSIGLAVFPEDADTKGALVECADRALYAAKRGGRDRVCVNSSGRIFGSPATA